MPSASYNCGKLTLAIINFLKFFTKKRTIALTYGTGLVNGDLVAPRNFSSADLCFFGGPEGCYPRHRSINFVMHA